MRIKTLFRTLAVTLLVSMTSISVSAANYVKVSDKDGKDTYFALSDKPTVTFTSTAMVLTAGSQTIEYPLTDSVLLPLPTSQQVLERLMQKATMQSFLLVTP